MPLFQDYVCQYPAVSMAGESFSSDRETSLYQTAKSDSISKPGLIKVIQAGGYDHTRLGASDPDSTNLTSGSRIAVVSRDRNHYNNYTPFNYHDQVGTNTVFEVPAHELIVLMMRGSIYVVVEKEINPANPVFVRVANPDTSGLQGIGFVTDTADGGNTVEITSDIAQARWLGSDSYSYLSSKPAFQLTAEQDRSRMGLNAGYAIAPLELNQP